MLVWDKRWKEHEGQIAELDDAQRLNLALGCIDHAVNLLGSSFVNAIPQSLRQELDKALSELWSSSETSRSNSLESHLEQNMPPGVYDIVMAIQMLHDCSPHECDTELVLECLSYCYQAILDVEILSRLERNMTEAEVNVLEGNNEKCMTCIDEQLKLLYGVASGIRVGRMQEFA